MDTMQSLRNSAHLIPVMNAPEKKLVLLIEDDTDSIFLQSKIIERTGAAVHVAANIDQALEFLETNRPDLVLTDLAFPEGAHKGFQFLLQAGISDHSRSVPVIMVSGSSDAGTKSNAARLGARDFIAKPFTSKRYEEQIKRVMNQPSPPPLRVSMREDPLAFFSKEPGGQKIMRHVVDLAEGYLLLTAVCILCLAAYSSILHVALGGSGWFISY